MTLSIAISLSLGEEHSFFRFIAVCWPGRLLQFDRRIVSGTVCYSCSRGSSRVLYVTRAVGDRQWHCMLLVQSGIVSDTVCYSCSRGSSRVLCATRAVEDRQGYCMLLVQSGIVSGTVCYSCSRGGRTQSTATAHSFGRPCEYFFFYGRNILCRRVYACHLSIL